MLLPDIEITTGITVFFADPYAAWHRGTNEHTNGLFRQLFPKGSEFNVVTQKDLAKAVANLNHRPRKYLDFKTPYDVRKKTVLQFELEATSQ